MIVDLYVGSKYDFVIYYRSQNLLAKNNPNN